jgi:hypothetical protein
MKTLQVSLLNLISSYKQKSAKSTPSKKCTSYLLCLFTILLLLPTQNILANQPPTDFANYFVVQTDAANPYNAVTVHLIGLDTDGYNERANNFVLSYSTDGKNFIGLIKYDITTSSMDFIKNTGYTYTDSTKEATLRGKIQNINIAYEGQQIYVSFKWYFPQKASGLPITFRLAGSWIKDYDQSKPKPENFTEDKLVTLNTFNPTTLVNPILKTINGTTDSNWFNFAWTSYDASKVTTSLELHSKSDYNSKITGATIANGGAGNLNIKLDVLNKVNSVYPKLVFTSISTDTIIYEKIMPEVQVSGFQYPKISSISFDKCNNKVSLNWSINVPTKVDYNSKTYIYRKSKGVKQYTLLTPSGLANDIFTCDDSNAAFDSVYTYIVRVCPNFLSPTATAFTNEKASNFLPELKDTITITPTRQKIDFSSFTAKGNLAVVNVSAANVVLSWKANWCTNNPNTINIIRKDDLNPLDIFNEPVKGSSLRYVDTKVVNRKKYRYCLVADNGGRIDSSEWVTVLIEDQCKFMKLTTTKGVLNDRVRLSWEIDKPELNKKFVIYRKLYDNNSNLFDYEMIGEKQSSNSIENWEDLSISPGVLYKYKIESYYQPPTGTYITVPSVDSIGDGLGFSQPIGTISGNIVFGSGTSVDSVNVSLDNKNGDQKLYKSLKFSSTDLAQGGTVKLKATKHGCVEKGFTWQAMLQPANRTQTDATIYEMKNEYSIRLDGNIIRVYFSKNLSPVLQLSQDISSISKDRYFQLTVSYNSTSKKLALYIDGVLAINKILTDTYTCKNGIEAKLATSYIANGKNYLGLIDEMRLWNSELTSKDIKNNFDRYLSGSETDLIGYWQMDEGIGGFAFDKSNVSKSYNENHITLKGVESSESVPTPEQLSIKSTTDANGNYLISGVPYKGNGSTYDVTPALGTHEFEPKSQRLFIGGASSEVQSKINFKDISSFEIRGYVYYQNTNYPVEGIQFKVDGVTCTRDNELILSNANGEYIIDVPIGEHKITLFKNGHTFDNNNPTIKLGLSFNFNVKRRDINFSDITKVKLVGRVAGGDVQAAKPIGFNRSTANIGQATVTIQPVIKEKYQLYFTKTVPDNKDQYGKSILTLGNGNLIVKSQAKVNFGGDTINITTDNNSGEFSVMVPPIPMKIINVVATGIDKSKFYLDNQPKIDMQPTITTFDTIHSGMKVVNLDTLQIIDSCIYNQRLNLTYQVPSPVFTIKDKAYTYNAFGDSKLMYEDPNNALNKDSLVLVTKENEVAKYKMGFPIFTQGEYYTFNIEAYESYVHPITKKEDRVPLNGKTFQIENKLRPNSAKTEYALDSLGQYSYTFRAGNPVLTGDYTMGMTATMTYNKTTINWMNNGTIGLRGIVLGGVGSGNGVDFVTKGPDKVIAVLRDPPGSNSFATLQKGTTVTNTNSYKGILKGSNNNKVSANLGFKSNISTGIGVAVDLETEVKAECGIGIESSSSLSGSKTTTETFTMSESISTSSSPDFVGAMADVFIANSSNIGFAKCKQLGIVPNGKIWDFKQTDSYTYIDMGDTTSFRYTQNHIVTKMIPEFRRMRESILKNIVKAPQTNYSSYNTSYKPTDPGFGTNGTYTWVKPTIVPKLMIDSVQFFTNQINNWENIIRRNEMEKLWAAGKSPIGNDSETKYDRTNLSIDAGVVLNKSVTRTSTSTSTAEETFELKFVTNTEAGVTVNDFGVTKTSEKSVGGGFETSQGKTTEKTVSYGYTLQDGDAGNYFSVDVYIPTTAVGREGGPIFVTRGGASSCPYEKGDTTVYYVNASNKSELLSTPTVQIEKPGLEVLVPTVGGISSGKQASFELVLQNLSSSSTASWLQLSVDPASNPHGAIISIDGTPLTAPRLFLVTSTPMHKIARISQSSTDDLDFKNLRFVLSSPCQSSINASALVSAEFVPSCSDLTLQIDDRTLNSATGSNLTVILKDFDKTYKNFGGIRLQYKGINDLNWSLAKEFVLDTTIMKPLSKDYIKINKEDISLTYKFPMATDPEQTYQFRARTVCAGNVYNETATIDVIKDMKKPLSMGLPSPSNGILTPETEVSVTFNENIQAEKIATTDIQVYGVLNGFTEKDNVGLAFDGTQKAFTELPLNLQSSSFTVEGKFLANTGNTIGNIFSIGEGENKVALQMIGNDLKVIAGSFTKQTTLSADANFQYFGLTYNATSKSLSLMLWSLINKDKTTIFTETLANGIAPVGRLTIGENFKGALRQISVWSEERTYPTINDSRSKSKTGKEMNLVGYWAMDEGYGTLAADKARGRNLTVGSSWFITPMGLAATLSGSNQIIAKSSHISLTTENDFGLEFWFRGAADQKNTTIYSCVGDTVARKNLSVAFNSIGNLTLATNGNSFIIPSGVVLDNNWHHFAFGVMRGGNANAYIDGIQKFQTSATNIGGMECDSITLGALRSIAIGATKPTITKRFKGWMDEVRIWNNAISTENVKLNLHSKLTGNETGLIAYYPFEKQNSLGDVVYSLADASIPAFSTMKNGGNAVGDTLNYSNNTPAIKVARTRVKVGSSFTASDNKIIINIIEDADRIENCVLEFEMDRIMDLNSNRLASPIKWSAFVNMNRLKWETETVNLTKEVLAPLTFEAVISNSSGKYENFVVTGLPSWLSVNKTQGTLSPLNKTTLVFTVDNSTNIGSYECDIRLTGSKNIDEILPVRLKVTGPRPNWAVNPYNYESTMNVIGKITIEGVYQEDPEDMLAAFKGSECVGIASPIFDKTQNSYILYMDIYGNNSENTPLTFSLWDAGTGRIYPGVEVGKTINYTASAIVGDVITPQIFNATDKVEQQLNLKQGWNWISTNVTSTLPTLITQFKTGIETAGIQLKSQTGYIDYANNLWTGNDFNLNQTSMYMVKTNQAKTIKMVGATAKAASLSMVINPLWNWIGYVPQFVSPVKDALGGLAAKDGDQIKGQIGFASYSGGKWYGSLQYLTPGIGYLYYSKNSAPSTFNYPSQYISMSKVAKQSEVAENMRWSVDANKYQMSMTVTCVTSINNKEVANSDMQVAVFVGDECRGTASLKYVDSYNRYMAFMMVWGNLDDVNKKITFKSFNTTNNQELSLSEQSLTYTPDNIVGSPVTPYQINFMVAGNNVVNMDNLKLYPNPVSDMLHFDCNTNGIEKVEVIDNLGRQLISYTQVNKNTINVSNLVPGVYTLRIKYNGNVTNHIFVRK